MFFRGLLSPDFVLDTLLLRYRLKLYKDLAQLLLQFLGAVEQLGVLLVIEHFFIEIFILFHLERFELLYDAPSTDGF